MFVTCRAHREDGGVKMYAKNNSKVVQINTPETEAYDYLYKQVAIENKKTTWK